MLQSLFRPVLRPIMMGVMSVTGSRRAWTPAALWPTGTEPGMWIDPSNLTSQWQDSAGTTQVSTPGTVADSSNPVGLALDIRAGAPTTLGPELVTNGDFSNGLTGWTVVGTATWTNAANRAKGIVIGAPSNSGGLRQDITVVAGVTYKISIEIDSVTANGYVAINFYDGAAFTPTLLNVQKNASGSYLISGYITPTGTTIRAYFVVAADAATTTTGYFDNISVKKTLGNHMSQATSTARPLLSARVNYLWQDLSGTYTGAGGYVRQPGVTVDDLGSGVYRVNFSADGQGLFGSITSNNAGLVAIVGTDYIGSIELSVESGTGTVTLKEPIGSQFADMDVSLTTAWTRFDTPATAATNTDFGLWVAKKAGSVSSCLARFPQLQIGSVATDYQRVTSASNYDATGFPTYQKYDGVDDSMATAAFTAGTLIDGMDCLIAVRRDSAGNAVCGLYESVAEANKVFGIAESGSGSGCVGSGAGTPTVWVDGVQLTGGTAVTRGTLHTALTVGDYHVLEFRGLDLSTWTASGFGLYTSYVRNVAQGGILLFPSSTSAADRDAARTWLGAKVGLTL